MALAKVLIADGDPAATRDLRAALEERDWEVFAEAARGRQLLALIRSLRPELVLLGIPAADSDDLEAAHTLRREGLAGVVVAAEQVDSSLIARADAAGVLAFLRKPLGPGDAAAALEIALGRHRERAELEAEVVRLKEKMEARKVVGRAKAVLMERYHLTEREAFQRIQTKSQSLQKPPHEIARAIITASELGNGAP